MNEHIWESFDCLWQTIQQLKQHLDALETRITELEAAGGAPHQGPEAEPGITSRDGAIPHEDYLQLAR